MLTKEQEEILIGALLGDASVEYNSKSCRVRFDYGIKQCNYVYWLANKLQPYSQKATQYDVFDSRTGKVNQKIRFYTSTNSIFNEYRSMFYSNVGNFKDSVPLNIKEKLSSKLTLAIWFLDDGAKRTDSKAFRLHTECFPFKIVQLLQEALFDNYGIKCTYNSHRNRASNQPPDKGFILHIGARNGNADKLNQLIKPFVTLEIPTMLYKFF